MKAPEKAEEKRCAKCGACVPVCPVYRASGRESLSARGRLHLLQKIPTKKWSSHLGDIVSRCLLCGACSAACPRGIDIVPLLQAARRRFPVFLLPFSFLAHLGQKILAHPLALSLTGKIAAALPRLHGRVPRNSGMALRLAALDSPYPRRARSKKKKVSAPGQPSLLFFQGCFATHLETEISDAVLDLVRLADDSAAIPPRQVCCGMAQAGAGDLDQARACARANILAFAGSNLPILCSCASCFHQLSRYPQLLADDPAWCDQASAFALRLREFSSFFLPRLEKKKFSHPDGRHPLRVFWHDPCHLRFPHKILSPPRRLLLLAPGLVSAGGEEASGCCGQGGFFSLHHPKTAEKIRRLLLDSLAGLNADLLSSTCTGCLLQLRQGLKKDGNDLPVMHLAVLLAQTLLSKEDVER